MAKPGAPSIVVDEKGWPNKHFPKWICCASPKLHPAEKLNRILDLLMVKSWLYSPTRAVWKAMKMQGGGIVARHKPLNA
jgi:hypothetical protein